MLFNCDLFFDNLAADLDAINSYFAELYIDKFHWLGSVPELSVRARYDLKFNECVANHITFVLYQYVRKLVI